jgi:hypothetical protein
MVVPGGQAEAISIPASSNTDMAGAGNCSTTTTPVSHSGRS